MKESVYRLVEYKIFASDTGSMVWEAHCGFGESQIGRCFRKGSILFIGPAEKRQDGFLKGEFLDELQRYPAWLDSRFFCLGTAVYHCEGGFRVSGEEMRSWRHPGPHRRRDRDPTPAPIHSLQVPVVGKDMEWDRYRLQKYEIAVTSDGKVVSITPSGARTAVVTECLVLEDILFITPGKVRALALARKPFFDHLARLPRWDGTTYFCKGLSLHECEPRGRSAGDPGRPRKERKTAKQQTAGAVFAFGAGWTLFHRCLRGHAPGGAPPARGLDPGIRKRTIAPFGGRRFGHSESNRSKGCARRCASGPGIARGIARGVRHLLSMAFVAGAPKPEGNPKQEEAE